jgi:hypothetical protein
MGWMGGSAAHPSHIPFTTRERVIPTAACEACEAEESLKQTTLLHNSRQFAQFASICVKFMQIRVQNI